MRVAALYDINGNLPARDARIAAHAAEKATAHFEGLRGA